MAKQFTLGKGERLKSLKQTESLFRDGKRFTLPPFRIHYHCSKKEKIALQFGVGVSAKTFSKATDRNRIKRMTREAYRLQKNELQEYLRLEGKSMDLFFIYTGKELPGYKELFDATGTVLRKLLTLTTTDI